MAHGTPLPGGGLRDGGNLYQQLLRVNLRPTAPVGKFVVGPARLGDYYCPKLRTSYRPMQEGDSMLRVRLFVALLSAAVLGGVVHAAGNSSIAAAAKSGDIAAVRKLIAAHTDVNAAAGDASTPLLLAVHNSDMAMVKVLLAAGAKPDIANHYGVTP